MREGEVTPPGPLLFSAQIIWNAHVASIRVSQMVLLVGNVMKHGTSGRRPCGPGWNALVSLSS